MTRKEIETSEPQCLRHYDEGYKDGKEFEKMSKEIMDDYDAGYTEGKKLTKAKNYTAGYNAGKEFAQNKIGELLEEVETAYKELARAEKMDSEASRIPKAQLNAVKFAKSWIASGGHTDLEGERVCLPW